MAEWGKGIGSWFWQDDFWVLKGYSWSDLTPEKIPGYPDYRDIISYPFFFSIIMLMLKYFIFYPLILSPLTESLGLPNRKHRKPIKSKFLENVFSQFGVHLPKDVMKDSIANMQWPQRKVERWLRRKQASLKLTVHEKFVDNFYTWVYKSLFFVYGLKVISQQPYFHDISNCWENYPHQAVDDGLWWYYMIGVSFCTSQTISFINQPIKTETIVIIIHHFITVALLGFSWVTNCVRIGSLILLLHEASDTVILIGKVFRYLKYEKTTDCCFALFIVVWFTTRVYIFPTFILKSIMFDLPANITDIPALYVFEILLFGIFALNMKWTVMIIAMIYRKLVQGVVDDLRSSDEYDTNEDTEDFSDARLSSN